jgi:transposase
MIGLPTGMQIWIVAGVTDMRRGFVGLSGMVQTALEQNPFSGQVFVFRGKRGDLLKLLWWDGDGLCLFAKRLERGRFVWPQATSGTVSLTPAQMSCCWKGSIGGDRCAVARRGWRCEQRQFPGANFSSLILFFRAFFSCAQKSFWHTARTMTLRATLPDLDALNHNELKALIFSQREQLAWRDTEIEHLKLLIAKLRRMQFGRKSEKLDRQIEQLELRLDELQATQAENTAASHPSAGVAPIATIAAKPARKPLPEHLPREVRTYPPKQKACPDCGGELKFLGEDVSEILEYVPARFKVIRQVRPKLACVDCHAPFVFF